MLSKKQIHFYLSESEREAFVHSFEKWSKKFKTKKVSYGDFIRTALNKAFKIKLDEFRRLKK